MFVNSEIVTADTSGVVKIWDIRNFACVQTITVEDEHDAKKQIQSFATCASLHRLVVLARNTCMRESNFHLFMFSRIFSLGVPICMFTTAGMKLGATQNFVIRHLQVEFKV